MSNNDGKQASVNKGISKWHVLAFGAPYIGVSFFMDSIGVIQGVYAKYYGIALTSLAIVLLISRIFDAVTDPLIGCFSDSYRARKGTRKPFVCVGGLCLIPCSYFLFVPSGDVSVMYFATWSLLFYLASTINMIPTYAWCSEISSESGERTALFSVLVFFGRVAGLVFYLVPFLPIFETTEITPETLKVSVLVGAALLLPGLYCSLRFAPDGPSRVPAVKTTESLSKNEVFRDLYDAVKGNKPFQIYMAAYFCTVLGLGMYGGLFYIYVDAFLGEGPAYAQLAILGLLGGLLLTPLAYKSVICLGKKNMWLISSGIVLCGILYSGQLMPGEGAFFGLLILKVILIFGNVCLAVIGMPMLSETIDYRMLTDKAEMRGAYISVFFMVVKGGAALGMALGLAIAGWLGFDATVTSHDEKSAFAIHMAISWVPFVISSAGLFFIWLTPLDERRSAIVNRRLNGRELS